MVVPSTRGWRSSSGSGTGNEGPRGSHGKSKFFGRRGGDWGRDERGRGFLSRREWKAQDTHVLWVGPSVPFSWVCPFWNSRPFGSAFKGGAEGAAVKTGKEGPQASIPAAAALARSPGALGTVPRSLHLHRAWGHSPKKRRGGELKAATRGPCSFSQTLSATPDKNLPL
jgi:hypothetical protein